MKHTFLYSLLLMIISAGGLFSQATQNDVRGPTTQNQVVANQDYKKEIAKTDTEPVIVVNKANKTAYKVRQLNRSRSRSCCSAHVRGAYQKAFSEYQRKKSSQYKRRLEKTDPADNDTSKNK